MKITFNNKYFNYVIFHYNLHNIFTTHVSNSINVEVLLFMKAQFTTNAGIFVDLRESAVFRKTSPEHQNINFIADKTLC